MYVVPPVLATLIEPTGAQAGLAVALGERLAEPEREPLFEGEAAPEAVALGGTLRVALREAETLREAATDAVAATEAPRLRETLGEAARESLREADGERDQEPLSEAEREDEREAEAEGVALGMKHCAWMVSRLTVDKHGSLRSSGGASRAGERVGIRRRRRR